MSLPICLIAGLGNPGQAYARTRHNLGYQIIDHVAEVLGVKWKQKERLGAFVSTVCLHGRSVCLVKPATYMNHSGVCLQKCALYYRIACGQCLVVYDDMTLELGRLKITHKGSSGGHRGVEDILQHLGDDFVRFRVGLGAKRGEAVLSDWILQNLTLAEQEVMSERLPFYKKAIETLVENPCQNIPQNPDCLL